MLSVLLHGDLRETFFMVQPQGYIDSTKPTHVCRMIKSIYGLRQAHGMKSFHLSYLIWASLYQHPTHLYLYGHAPNALLIF